MTMIQLKDIIEKYIVTASLYGDETEKGNYKEVNKLYKKLTRLYKQFESTPEIAFEALELLLRHQNNWVKLWSAAHALGLKLHIQEATETLEKISKQQPGNVRFDAEMTLKTWKENGKLSF